MRKVLLACVLVMLFGSKVYADGAIFVPIQHSDLLNSGTNTHAIIDTFIASKGQPNGLAALDGSGNIVVSGYIGATNGTGTGTRLDNVQINSGTGTLSGVPSPYIAQTSGTSTGGSHTSSYIYGSSTIQSTSTSDSYLSGNFAVGSTTPPCKFLVLVSQLSGHVKYVDTQALIEKNGNTALEIASNSTNSGSLVFSDENSTGGLISYSHILDRLAIYVGHNLASLGNPQFTVNSSGSVTASNLITGWRAGSTYGYGLLNLVSTGDISFTPTYDNSAKSGTITAALTLAASSKPNILQDGELKAITAGSVSFNLNFHVDSDGSVTVRNLVQQTNGTASGLHLTSVQIASGTGTLSGVAAPYIAQTSGTGTLLTVGSVSVSHNGASITGGTISGVDMCFGDNDTGVNWIEDGHIQFKTNSNQLIALSSVGIPSVVVIGTTTHTVNTTLYGNLTVTGTTTLNGLVRSQLFNTPGNGTFTASTSVIYVTVMGGGGGGGGGSGEGGSGDFGGGGGGSGQFIPRTPLIVTNGNDYSVVVGAGGSGGTAGAATGGNLDGGAGGVGGTSTFSTLLTASGGGGGGGGDYNTAPGAGGSGGSYNSVGILGKNGNAGGNEDGGTGAISALGSIGGVGGIVSVGTSSIVSMQGCGGGGGGCGTNTYPNSPGYAGGNGSSGFVLVEY